MDEADRAPPQTMERQDAMKVSSVKYDDASDRVHGVAINNQVSACEVSGRDLPTLTYIAFIAMRGGFMIASYL